jgi:acetyl-CoA carboxylase carboxyltransferase component
MDMALRVGAPVIGLNDSGGEFVVGLDFFVSLRFFVC